MFEPLCLVDIFHKYFLIEHNGQHGDRSFWRPGISRTAFMHNLRQEKSGLT